jgi:hypothetical protein
MKRQFAVFALLILAAASSAAADTVSGTVTGGTAQTAGGTFVLLTPPLLNPFGPPNSVGDDNFQSPNLFAFDEQQNVTLASPLAVDSGSPIVTGTVISSQYVFFDPGPTEDVIGTVNFGSDVLGIISSTGTLAASDFLAFSGVNYLDPAERGLEAGDSVTMSGPQQILWNTVASSPGDYVRVITAGKPVTTTMPEPSGVLLLGVGLLGLAIIRQTVGGA